MSKRPDAYVRTQFRDLLMARRYHANVLSSYNTLFTGSLHLYDMTLCYCNGGETYVGNTQPDFILSYLNVVFLCVKNFKKEWSHRNERESRQLNYTINCYIVRLRF